MSTSTRTGSQPSKFLSYCHSIPFQYPSSFIQVLCQCRAVFLLSPNIARLYFQNMMNILEDKTLPGVNRLTIFVIPPLAGTLSNGVKYIVSSLLQPANGKPTRCRFSFCSSQPFLFCKVFSSKLPSKLYLLMFWRAINIETPPDGKKKKGNRIKKKKDNPFKEGKSGVNISINVYDLWSIDVLFHFYFSGSMLALCRNSHTSTCIVCVIAKYNDKRTLSE